MAKLWKDLFSNGDKIHADEIVLDSRQTVNQAVTNHKEQKTSEVIVLTRNIATTGTQRVTLPFKVKSIFCVSFINATLSQSIGMWSESGVSRTMGVRGSDKVMVGGVELINLRPDGSSQANASISNISDTGFNLVWGKGGSPTGTATIYILAMTH